MLDQASVLVKKNLTLHTRSRQFMVNLYIPVLCSLFTLISQYYNNTNASLGLILGYMYQLWPLYLVMPANGIIRQTVAIIIEERQGRFKDIQRTMGMQLNAYYLSWVLSTVALCLMTSAIYIIPQLIFQTYSFPRGDMNFSLAFLTYLLYTLGSACFNLFLSSFFDEASIASEVLGLGNLFLALFGFGAAIPNTNVSWLYYIFPQTLLQTEWFSQRWWYDIYQPTDSINIGVMIVFQILQIIVYLLGYLYFDQVMPRESGPSKQPLFFLQGNSQQVYMDLEEDLLPQRQEQLNISLQIQNEPFNIQQHQVNLEPLVYLNDVSKRLGGQTILQSISLEIYPGEIFFLLGPNGSGKTTLSNIIAGFSKPSGGVVKVCGQDQGYQGQISICMQKDILYADLTVWDHLYFYAHLKNVYRENFLQQGAQLLETCLLSLYRDIPASQLSGGNKRKLCLAIALLGDPKVIILDEPSSGVDPVTREELWRVIRSVKQGRAIFMTTHHLEEAEELASRVGILFGGQIVTMGTVDYIKSSFGLGYNLTLEFADQMTLKANKDRVQKELGLESREINQHTLMINLPPSIMGQYYQILTFLETQIPCQISLFQNSLEDAYLAVEKRNSHEQIDQDCQQVFRAEPEITFSKQVQAMAWRKYLILTASKGKLFRQFYTWPIILLGIRFGIESPIFFVLLYILAKCLSISSVLSIPVEENEKRIKDYLISSGLEMTAYWTGTFLADLVPIIIESLFIAISLTVFDVGFWAQNIGLVFIVLVFFGMNFNAFCYFVSLYIKKSLTAYVTLPILTFFVMFWLLFIPFALDVGATNFITILTMIASPLLSLYMGLALTPNMYSDALFSVGSCLGWMVLSSAIYFTIIVWIEKKRSKKNSQENNTEAIKCTGISKGLILDNLDFSVKEGEIFGLLGPNGAGKTTAFNILTNFDQQTSGAVQIQGNKIGTVPQFSPFYSHLNIYQHMKIYGLIKGQVEIEDCIQRYLRAVGLDGMQKRQVRFLSGGERRKLQIGLALIGGSNRLFMDEPTSGLDPKARKVVQSILTQSARNSNASVIITTHSLLEAQTICDRVGILVNGRIVALGTMEQLRTALGGFMRISMCCNAGRQAQVNATTQQYLSQYFPIQQVPDNRDIYLSYQFTPQKLSLLYFFLQKELKERHQLITNYNIFQTQLDQIFKFYTLLQNPGIQVQEAQNQFMPGDALRILTGACCCTFW